MVFEANGRVRLRFDALGGKELSFKPAELAMLRAAGAAGAATAEDDGEMERREAALRAESDALFKQLDRNGDGALSRKEVTKGLQVLEKSTGLKVRKTRSWPRSWAKIQPFKLYSYRNAWPSSCISSEPNIFLAPIECQIDIVYL